MKKILGLATLSFSLSALAIELQPIMSVGFESGGDDVASFTYENNKKRTMKAGSGAVFSGGVSVANPISEHELSTRASFSFKGAALTATNAELNFFRWILEVAEHYAIPKSRFQVGAGLTYHLSNKLTGTGDATSIDGALKPSLGMFLGAEYYLQRDEELPLGVRSTLIGLRYVRQSYESETSGAEKLAASSFGLNLSLLW